MANRRTEGVDMTVSDQFISDNLLLEGVSAGDTLSFETLFYRYYDRVYGILFRLVGNRAEAEDLTQEVFLKLYQKPPRHANNDHIGGWLYRVATNHGYNHLRGQNRRWQYNRWLVPGHDRNAPELSENNPAQVVERREAQASTRAALARLPERQTQLLLLRQMGLSYAELAEACSVAPGSVGTLLARAAKAFEKAYEKERNGGKV